MAQPLENELRDLLLDADGDLVIGTDLSWTTGIDAVVQSCRIALNMIAGEWFLDLDAGIAYFDDDINQSILGSRSEIAKALARDEFRRELESVEGVLEVLRLDVDFVGATRELTIVWQVRTALGETPVDTLTPRTT